MTSPTDDAGRAREYYQALLAMDLDKEVAQMFCVAWIQAEAMKQIPAEPATRPGPKRVHD